MAMVLVCPITVNIWLLLVTLSIILLSAPACGSDTEDFPQLPLLHVQGSNHQIGYSIGMHFKENIQKTINDNKFFKEQVLAYNKTSEGQKNYEHFFKKATDLFPQYMEELEGKAKGAEIDFDVLFLWNMLFEYNLLLKPDTLPTPACSDLYLFPDSKHTLMAHNEDGPIVDISTGYMVNATLDNGDHFVAYCYPGELCGNAFSYNFKTGIAQTVNAVFPKNLNLTGVGRNFLNRALLSMSFVNIERTLLHTTCASGFSLNVGWLVGEAGFSVSNFEVSPMGFTEYVYNAGFNYHFNMYLHSPKVEQNIDASSLHRLARIKEFPIPKSMEDLLSCLGDTKDPQYPIYRTAKPPDNAATIATALFDLTNARFYVYRGNPSSTEPAMTFQL